MSTGGLNQPEWSVTMYNMDIHTKLIYCSSQRAFICNFREHWLTIRRLGAQWFNLNSLLTGPELISDTFLALTLAQLQRDGYSIYLVVGELPDCQVSLLHDPISNFIIVSSIFKHISQNIFPLLFINLYEILRFGSVFLRNNFFLCIHICLRSAMKTIGMECFLHCQHYLFLLHFQ